MIKSLTKSLKFIFRKLTVCLVIGSLILSLAACGSMSSAFKSSGTKPESDKETAVGSDKTTVNNNSSTNSENNTITSNTTSSNQSLNTSNNTSDNTSTNNVSSEVNSENNNGSNTNTSSVVTPPQPQYKTIVLNQKTTYYGFEGYFTLNKYIEDVNLPKFNLGDENTPAALYPSEYYDVDSGATIWFACNGNDVRPQKIMRYIDDVGRGEVAVKVQN